MSHASPVMPDMIEPGDISAPLERLRAGEPFVELLDNDVATRAATLECLLGRLPDSETKLVWIGNPLRSPLTLERLFLQAAGPQADLRVERTPAELVAMLRSALEGAARCLLIVQQPETLDPEARDTLADIAPLLSETAPVVQFLFCGSMAFRPIAKAPPASPPVALTRLDNPALALEPRSPSRAKLPLFLLLCVAAGGAVVTWSTGEKPVSAIAVSPAEAIVPAANAASGEPDPAPAAAPKIDVVTLRREFDAFIAQQPRASRLTPEQRDELFNEFLARDQGRQPTP